MPGALEAVDSYLIKVGWTTDPVSAGAAYKHVEGTLGGMQEKASQFLRKSTEAMQNSTIGKFAAGAFKIGKATFSAVTLIGKAAYDASRWLFNMSDALAESDLQAEKLSRMWGITERAARSYQKALDVMGVGMEDIWKMTDEEFARFQDLQATFNALEPNEDFQQFAVTFRDISYQASKFNAQIEMIRNQFVGGIFAESKDFFYELRGDLEAVNNWVTTKGSVIAEKAGRFFGKVVNMVKYIYRIGKRIFNGISAFEAKTGLLKKTLQEMLSPIVTAYAYLEDLLATLAGEQYTYLNVKYGQGNKDGNGNNSAGFWGNVATSVTGNENFGKFVEEAIPEVSHLVEGIGESVSESKEAAVQVNADVERFNQAVKENDWQSIWRAAKYIFTGEFLKTDHRGTEFENGVFSPSTYNAPSNVSPQSVSSGSVTNPTEININQNNNVVVSAIEQASKFVDDAVRNLAKQAQESNPYA